VGHVIHIPYDVKTTAVPGPAVPNAVAIQDIRPNPTTGATTITLALPARARTRVVAYDMNGRLVRTLFSGTMEAGVRPISWDGRSERGEKAPGGIYFIRLESANRISVKKLVILN
jgi:flagellar hook assembly protein FlgD